MKEYESPMAQVVSVSVDGALTDPTVASYGMIDLGLGEPGVGDVQPPAPQ